MSNSINLYSAVHIPQMVRVAMYVLLVYVVVCVLLYLLYALVYV